MNQPTRLPLQHRVLVIWRLLLLFATAVPAFLLSLFLPALGLAWSIGMGALGILFLFYFVYYIPRYYETFVAELRRDSLAVTNGVFGRSTHMVHPKNVQYTTRLSNPFDRLFGVVTVRVIIAGGSLIVPGLLPADADLLVAHLAQTEVLPLPEHNVGAADEH